MTTDDPWVDRFNAMVALTTVALEAPPLDEGTMLIKVAMDGFMEQRPDDDLDDLVMVGAIFSALLVQLLAKERGESPEVILQDVVRWVHKNHRHH